MRFWWVGLIAVANVACGDGSDGATGGGTETETETGGDTDRPSPYAESSDSTGGEPPSMEPDDAVAAAMAGLQIFLTLDPTPVMTEFETLSAKFEDGCPEQLETGEGKDGGVATIFYSEGCTTSTGLTVRGGGRYERIAIEEDDFTREGAFLSSEGADFRLTDGDTWLQLSGYIGYEKGVEGETSEAYVEVAGSLLADSDTAKTSPLFDPGVTASGAMFSFASGGTKALGGSGALSGEGIGDARAIAFSDIILIPAACGSEPIGTLSARDDVGFWHDVVFDAGSIQDDEPVFDDEKCDGCGSYLAGGESLGDACLTTSDIDGLFDWETYPW